MADKADKTPNVEAAATPGAASAEAAKQGMTKTARKRQARPPELHREDFDYTFCYCEENAYRLIEKIYIQQQIEKLKGAPGPFSRFDKLYIGIFSNYTRERKNEVENDWNSIVPVRVSPGAENDFARLKFQDCCVTWDYHVVALLHVAPEGKRFGGWFVADFDTSHPGVPDKDCLLLSLSDYISRAFNFTDLYNKTGVTRMNPKKLQAFVKEVLVRVIPGLTFLTYFRSDRGHMKDKKGNYLHPPPKAAEIKAPSPIALRLLGKAANDIVPYRPDFKSNLSCYINMRQDSSLTPFLGDVVNLSDLSEFLEKIE